MTIYMEEGQAPIEGLETVLAQAAELALDKEGVESRRAAISLTWVDPEEIRTLNRDYRQVDSVTDVLSFPQFEDLDELPEEGEIMLGDVVICIQRAREQAAEYGHSLKRELVYLFVHSVLHLLGYDHMEGTERQIMRRREEEIMDALAIPRTPVEQEPLSGGPAGGPDGSETSRGSADLRNYAEVLRDPDGSETSRGSVPGCEVGREALRALYRQACDALQNAYAPYSHFAVGAALLAADGRVFTGVNVENASFGATICAERTAFVKAVSEGVRSFRAIAIASSGGTAWPCGICRQFMSEFCGPDFLVATGESAAAGQGSSGNAADSVCAACSEDAAGSEGAADGVSAADSVSAAGSEGAVDSSAAAGAGAAGSVSAAAGQGLLVRTLGELLPESFHLTQGEQD